MLKKIDLEVSIQSEKNTVLYLRPLQKYTESEKQRETNIIQQQQGKREVALVP